MDASHYVPSFSPFSHQTGDDPTWRCQVCEYKTNQGGPRSVGTRDRLLGPIALTGLVGRVQSWLIFLSHVVQLLIVFNSGKLNIAVLSERFIDPGYHLFTQFIWNDFDIFMTGRRTIPSLVLLVQLVPTPTPPPPASLNTPASRCRDLSATCRRTAPMREGDSTGRRTRPWRLAANTSAWRSGRSWAGIISAPGGDPRRVHTLLAWCCPQRPAGRPARPLKPWTTWGRHGTDTTRPDNRVV